MKNKFEANNEISRRKLEVGVSSHDISSLRLDTYRNGFLLAISAFFIFCSTDGQAKHHVVVTSKTTTTKHHTRVVTTTKTSTRNRTTNSHHKQPIEIVEKKTIKVVRDRHGRIIKPHTETKSYVQPVAHSRYTPPSGHFHWPTTEHEPLQKEEHVVVSKEKIEPQSPIENQETPAEYKDFQKAYALYDEGTNARLAGNYSLAISNISRALNLVPGNAHGGPSVLVLNMEFDLAQAAEKNGDLQLAARYYARALADRPNFPEASIRLAKVLALNGKLDDALRAARDGVSRSPSDARVHSMLAILLSKNGQDAESKQEKKRAQNLLSSNGARTYVQPNSATPPSFKQDKQNQSSSPSNQPNNDNGSSAGNSMESEDSDNEGLNPN